MQATDYIHIRENEGICSRRQVLGAGNLTLCELKTADTTSVLAFIRGTGVGSE